MKQIVFRSLMMALLMIMLGAGACAKNSVNKQHEEGGMFSRKIRFRTLPTKAKIYIDDVEVGETPFTYKVKHEERRMINIKAVPLYPNQYTQNIFLMVPPVPKTMTIYMNHYPEDYDRSKDTLFTPPEKPLPEVIIQTKVDTLIIEKKTTDVISYVLPVIYFDTDSYVIKATEDQKLQDLIAFLKQNRQFSLDIYGFADHRASEKHNISLTLNRAGAVKDYMIRNGIDANRLFAYGHGKVSKVTTDGIELDLAESRKVLFLLIEKQ